MAQHVGFLWRRDRVTLTAFADVEELNSAAFTGSTPAAYEVLSDHCPVLIDLHNADLDD